MSDHLFVLVHGLWGNPSHLWCVEESLRARHPDCHILLSTVNEGNRTYDGVDVCGERIATEVLQYIDTVQQTEPSASSQSSAVTLPGTPIRHISFVGYSLGGLAARYAIGVLQQHGLFDEIAPVSFTTFATPHVGVSPTSTGFFSWLVTALGPRSLSMTGAHLFLADHALLEPASNVSASVPLLQAMSDPRSSFYAGLARFKQRQAYANIVFDRSVPYWTAAFSAKDPFTDLTKVQLQHEAAYDDVVLEAHQPVLPRDRSMQATLQAKDLPAGLGVRDVVLRVTLFALLPVWLAVFAVNAVVATFKSRSRIALHGRIADEDHEGKHPVRDRARLLAGLAQEVVEEVLDSSPEEPRQLSKTTSADDVAQEGLEWVPNLQLTGAQRAIIQGLSSLSWERYCVHIHKTQHTHAAIVCRMKDTPRVEEGKVVMRHWLDHLQMP